MPDLDRFLASHRNTALYIGKLAELTGASRKAIRHYESLGLLPKPKRRGSYRVYSDKDIFRVHVIKHAQTFGFTLKELRELVGAIGREKAFPLNVALSVVRRKQAAVRREVAALRQLDRRLAGLLAEIKKQFG